MRCFLQYIVKNVLVASRMHFFSLSSVFISQTKETFPERAEKIRDYVEGSIQQVTVKRQELEQGFEELVLEYTHLTNKYRGLVNIAQVLS